MAAYLYILKSLKNNRYYIGATVNLEERLLEHNSGKSKYTNLTRPFTLVFSKEFKSYKEAKQIEYRLKSFKSRGIIDKIVSTQRLKLGL